MAFALVIGAAVLTGTAVASAETPDSGTTGTETTSASSSPSPSEEPNAEAAEEEAAPAANEESETSSPAGDSTDAPLDSDSAPLAADTATERSAQSSSVAPTAVAEASPFDRFFNNQTPTLDYDPAENFAVDGRIEGDLNPVDPDSTRLMYRATKRAHGTVVINSDGTFVYTPGETYAGQDRFDVTVSDARSGFHLHARTGLLSLFKFGLLDNSDHRTTETVFIGFERAVAYRA
ncbi:MAG: cadherin-like domain-containing protein [Mycobacterium sp.]